MIIKEYRIPLPLAVEEYRIAQLYMIAKKSKLESEGEDLGVEITKNEPYTEGPGGEGQYTDKIYHIASYLPVWLRGFLPKAFSTVREEAWNAYPYSKNLIYAPYLDKFEVVIESKYLPGGTNRENVFELDEKELVERKVDLMDFVNDYSGYEHIESENPLTFASKKTNRGPLTKDWLKTTDLDAQEDGNAKYMTVYKLIRMTFQQWPIQYRAEQFCQDQMRKVLVRAHRQAWAWQDEWHGLTIEQIREMERETQAFLAKKMGGGGDCGEKTVTEEGGN